MMPENKRGKLNHQPITYNRSHVGTAPEVYLPHWSENKILLATWDSQG